MQVAIVSDTHIPSRAQRLPEPFRGCIRISGNVHPAVSLPSVASVDLGGVTFVVTHGAGSPRGWHDRVAEAVGEAAEEPRVGVAGHTRGVVDTEHRGARLLNPGGAAGASPAGRSTMMTTEATDGELEVTVHEAD